VWLIEHSYRKYPSKGAGVDRLDIVSEKDGARLGQQKGNGAMALRAAQPLRDEQVSVDFPRQGELR